jgi:hypothetical protein
VPDTVISLSCLLLAFVYCRLCFQWYEVEVRVQLEDFNRPNVELENCLYKLFITSSVFSKVTSFAVEDVNIGSIVHNIELCRLLCMTSSGVL